MHKIIQSFSVLVFDSGICYRKRQAVGSSGSLFPSEAFVCQPYSNADSGAHMGGNLFQIPSARLFRGFSYQLGLATLPPTYRPQLCTVHVTMVMPPHSTALFGRGWGLFAVSPVQFGEAPQLPASLESLLSLGDLERWSDRTLPFQEFPSLAGTPCCFFHSVLPLCRAILHQSLNPCRGLHAETRGLFLPTPEYSSFPSMQH